MLRIVPPEADLIEETVKCIIDTCGEKIDNVLLVFPTRRMQYFLLDVFARYYGKNFIPPRMLTADDLFEYLYKKENTGSVRADEVEASFRIFEIVEKQYPELLKGRSNFIDFFPWALQMLNAVESINSEASETDPPFEEYKSFVNLGEYEREYKMFIEILPRITGEYNRIMQEKKRFTRGMTYRFVSADAEKGKIEVGFSRVFITGFHSFNNAEKKLFKYLIKRPHTTFIVRTDQESLDNPESPFHLQSEMLKELGLHGEINAGNGQWLCKSDISLFETPDKETEIASVAREIEDLFKKNEDLAALKRIAIVLPDPTSLIPVIHHIVSRLSGIPFNISLQYPFSRTPLFQLLDSVLKLTENIEEGKFRTGDYLAIIRHPYVKLSDPSKDEVLRQAIHLVENIIAGNNVIRATCEDIISELQRLDTEKLDIDENLKDSIISSISRINDIFILPVIANLRTTTFFLKNIVSFLFDSISGGMFLKEYSTIAYRALFNLEKFLDDHWKYLDNRIQDMTGHPADSKTDFTRIASFIRYYLKKAVVPFEGSPLKGIQILGMLETRGLNFDEVFLLDALEGNLPENRKYDPILPPDIKRIFGMRDYHKWEALFAYNFFTLTANANRIRIFYPKKRDGKETTRSRYIESLIYSYEREKNEGFPINRVNVNFKPLRPRKIVIEKNQDIIDRILKVEYSPSLLKQYLDCPLKLYYEKIAGISQRDELIESVDQQIWGQIVHSIMREIMKKAIAKEKNSEDSLFYKIGPEYENLEPYIESLVEKFFNLFGFSSERGINRIKAWNMTSKITEPIISELERLKSEKITGILTETTVRSILEIDRDNLHNSTRQNISLKGTIDRIDRHSNSESIIDYKTGSSFRDKEALIQPERLNSTLSELDNTDDVLERHKVISKQIIGLQVLFYIYIYVNSGDKKRKGDVSVPEGYFFLFDPIEEKYIKESSHPDSPYLLPVVAGLSNSDKMVLLDDFEYLLSMIFREILSPEIPFIQTKDTDVCAKCIYLYLCRGS